MNISKDTVVTLNYTVNAGPGQPPESGQQAYLHGGYGNTFAKLEAALEGQAPGFATTLVLQPEDAFGVRDESLVRTIPKSEFPPGVKVGGQLRGMTDDGREQDQGAAGAARRQPPLRRQGAALHAQGARCACRHAGGSDAWSCAWGARASPPLKRTDLLQPH